MVRTSMTASEVDRGPCDEQDEQRPGGLLEPESDSVCDLAEPEVAEIAIGKRGDRWRQGAASLLTRHRDGPAATTVS